MNEENFNINIQPYEGCTVNGEEASNISDGPIPANIDNPSHINLNAIGENGATVIGGDGIGLTCNEDSGWVQLPLCEGTLREINCGGFGNIDNCTQNYTTSGAPNGLAYQCMISERGACDSYQTQESASEQFCRPSIDILPPKAICPSEGGEYHFTGCQEVTCNDDPSSPYEVNYDDPNIQDLSWNINNFYVPVIAKPGYEPIDPLQSVMLSPCTRDNLIANYSNIQQCPEGHIKTDASNNPCVECPLGFIANSSRTNCIECDSGTYPVSPGFCNQCPLVKYNNLGNEYTYSPELLVYEIPDSYRNIYNAIRFSMSGNSFVLTKNKEIHVIDLIDGEWQDNLHQPLVHQLTSNYIMINSVDMGGDTIVANYMIPDQDEEIFLGNIAAYAFSRGEDGLWIEEPTNLESLVPQSDIEDYFGTNVATDGNTIVVSSWNPKALFIFEKNAEGVISYKQKLILSNQSYLDRTRLSTTLNGTYLGSLSIDGNTIVCGFDIMGATSTTRFRRESGIVYVFYKDPSGLWLEKQVLTPLPGEQSIGFGRSVSVSGDNIVVGMPNLNRASVYVYSKEIGDFGSISWTRTQDLADEIEDRQTNDGFGISVSIDGDKLVVASPLDDSEGTCRSCGGAYLFSKGEDNLWTKQYKLSGNSEGITRFNSGRYGRFLNVNNNPDGTVITMGGSYQVATFIDDNTSNRSSLINETEMTRHGWIGRGSEDGGHGCSCSEDTFWNTETNKCEFSGPGYGMEITHLDANTQIFTGRIQCEAGQYSDQFSVDCMNCNDMQVSSPGSSQCTNTR